MRHHEIDRKYNFEIRQNRKYNFYIYWCEQKIQSRSLPTQWKYD